MSLRRLTAAASGVETEPVGFDTDEPNTPPKTPQEFVLPAQLEPRQRIDRPLWAVIRTAYNTDTSTRKSTTSSNTRLRHRCLQEERQLDQPASLPAAPRNRQPRRSHNRATPPPRDSIAHLCLHASGRSNLRSVKRPHINEFRHRLDPGTRC